MVWVIFWVVTTVLSVNLETNDKNEQWRLYTESCNSIWTWLNTCCYHIFLDTSTTAPPLKETFYGNIGLFSDFGGPGMLVQGTYFYLFLFNPSSTSMFNSLRSSPNSLLTVLKCLKTHWIFLANVHDEVIKHRDIIMGRGKMTSPSNQV